MMNYMVGFHSDGGETRICTCLHEDSYGQGEGDTSYCSWACSSSGTGKKVEDFHFETLSRKETDVRRTDSSQALKGWRSYFSERICNNVIVERVHPISNTAFWVCKQQQNITDGKKWPSITRLNERIKRKRSPSFLFLLKKPFSKSRIKLYMWPLVRQLQMILAEGATQPHLRCQIFKRKR